MNRRQLIAAAPAVVVVSVSPAASQGEKTPIERKYSEWWVMHQEWLAVCEANDIEADDAAYAVIAKIEDEMMALQCLTPKDMAIKMLVGHGFGDQTCLDYNGPVWAEARALVAA